MVQVTQLEIPVLFCLTPHLRERMTKNMSMISIRQKAVALEEK